MKFVLVKHFIAGAFAGAMVGSVVWLTANTDLQEHLIFFIICCSLGSVCGTFLSVRRRIRTATAKRYAIISGLAVTLGSILMSATDQTVWTPVILPGLMAIASFVIVTSSVVNGPNEMSS